MHDNEIDVGELTFSIITLLINHSITTICCSGEGLFNTTFTGPGKIWIQSLSIDKMRKLFPPNVQESGGTSDFGGGGD